LPDTNQEGARQIAETLRRGVAGQAFTHGQKLAISLGAAEARADETVNSPLQRANDRLYQAKALGRNRVIVGMEEDQSVKPY
jgi:PleD family two-component response regulator